jgi:hypothetical protein
MIPLNIKDAKPNNGITITFCDRGENHIGNQMIGNIAASGFTFEELQVTYERLQKQEISCTLTNLDQYLPSQYGTQNAGVLVIRNGLEIFMKQSDGIWDELNNLTYDKHAFMYGTVKSKHARHNLCFGDVDQTADYENGKGTIVGFHHLPYLSHIRQYLPVILNQKATNLVAEANHYYDVTKCGISFHGLYHKDII